MPQFSLNNLFPGDWAELRAYELNNQYTLIRLERDVLETNVRIQAPVDEYGIDPINKTSSILGITIATNGDTDYEDINNQPILVSVFFRSVQEGDLGKTKWQNFTSNTLPVDELSPED